MSIGKKLNMSFMLFIILLTVSLLLIKEIRFGFTDQEVYINSMILNPILETNKEQLLISAAELDKNLIKLKDYLETKEIKDWWQQLNESNQYFNDNGKHN
ncbi:hypothetical protein ACQKNC_13485 [Lysinibacillus sp. NPDC094177]|uniref:hypothetical protein n=1 Tax=Lysinibacillus sp. NPDC094177 TaxID=3390580 RepID=UPI003CFE51B0